VTEVRDPWCRAVIKHSTLTNATKLLLVVLVDDMKLDGRVSVPRSELAKKLGVHPSRITERIKEAVDARVLDVVQRGRPGVTAEYQALLSDGAPVRTKKARRRLNPDGAPVRTMQQALHGARTVPSDGADGGPSDRLTLGAPVQSPSTTHSPFDTAPAVVGEKPKGANNEKGNGRTHVTDTSDPRQCALCNEERKLGDDGLCADCAAAAFARSPAGDAA